MGPDARGTVLGDDALKRLTSVATVDTGVLVTDFGDPAYAEQLGTAEVLFTCWGCPPLTEEALNRMPGLRAVIHAAGSVKGHVTEAVWNRGIRVTTAAAANALPVAEYTVAAILNANKRVLGTSLAYRQARCQLNPLRLFPGLGNYRRTVGIVGASRIGSRVIELLAPFDLELLVHDPYLPEERSVDLDDLVRRSDVVSIHAPELPETRHMFNRERLALLTDGATLINTARGGLVDTEALTAELVSGRIHAVLDVTEPEVLPADSPLYDLPNVLLTPHIAGSLGRELGRLAEYAIDEVERYARGLPLVHEVHSSTLSRSA
ncbi:hydroxyacid dehydrogenase [Streptomyces pathocidini]|uniref:hydroxyacid dehydrogenase n=1 Tax=Streptomyces pathocidini TaxID=1650571 RepID=UPI0034002474